MTYEELFIAIDDAAPKLPGCALRLLLRLIAMAIKSGSNEIRISIRTLAAEMDITKDAVTVATIALKDVVTTQAAPGVPCTFTLPADWFAPQRSLFAVAGSVENRLRRPGNQDTAVLETRTLLGEKPGQSVLETRTQWATYQDGVSRKPGQLGEKPGHSVLETRTPDMQNQQLSANPLDRSSRVLSSADAALPLRDSIEGANRIPPEFAENAETLKRWLRNFFVKHHPSHNPPDGPDEVILAKCLAVAPLPRLAQTLTTLDDKGTQPRDSWAWFVTVFCQRIHKTKLWDEVRAPEGFHQPKKPASSEGGAQFSADLLQEVTAGARSM